MIITRSFLYFKAFAYYTYTRIYIKEYKCIYVCVLCTLSDMAVIPNKPAGTPNMYVTNRQMQNKIRIYEYNRMVKNVEQKIE